MDYTLTLLLITISFVILSANGAPLKLAVIGYLANVNSSGTETDWVSLQGLHSMFPIAIKHFNERNGMFVPKFAQLGGCNKTIELVSGVLLDDHAMPSAGMKALLNALPSGLDFVLGSMFSAVTLPLATTCGALEIPIVSYWATSAALSDKSVYPTFARTIPDDDGVAQVMATAFNSWGFKYVGVSLKHYRSEKNKV